MIQFYYERRINSILLNQQPLNTNKNPREKENSRGKPKRKGGKGNSVNRLPIHKSTEGKKGYNYKYGLGLFYYAGFVIPFNSSINVS
jgi:hypothetical protein